MADFDKENSDAQLKNKNTKDKNGADTAYSELSELSMRLKALTVFRALCADPVVSALASFPDADADGRLSRLVSIAAALYESGTNDISEYLKRKVFGDENVYIKSEWKGGALPEIYECAKNELQSLDLAAAVSPETLRRMLSEGQRSVPLPSWKSAPRGARLIEKGYFERVRDIERCGYGIYSVYRMFSLDKDGNVSPVENPDPVRLSELVGYEREKKIIIDNTKALISGKPAANVLLTGDAGTGKSSTVKAVVNELYSNGLRLIEIRKEQLSGLPAVIDSLNSNPLKFIIFIDDLSFAKNDDNFSALKAVLEGSVFARSQNVAIYATSNRRHLVRETFSDRQGDDVHVRDTMQETVSLSERFGIQVTFSRPDKNTYLTIVKNLAEARGMTFDEASLFEEAERFALSRSSRSARAARQFVDSLESSAKDP